MNRCRIELGPVSVSSRQFSRGLKFTSTVYRLKSEITLGWCKGLSQILSVVVIFDVTISYLKQTSLKIKKHETKDES